MNLIKSTFKCGLLFSAFICVFCFMVASSLSSDTITLKLFEKSEIQKSEILFEDICEFEGSDLALIRKIEKIKVGSVPLAGTSKVLDHHSIQTRLKQNNVDVSRIELVGPQYTVAIRKNMLISEKQLKQIILAYLQRKLPWDAERVKFDNIRVDDELLLPDGEISYQVVSPPNTDFLGKTTLSIDFSVNGDFVKKSWATLDIAVFSEVVVAKRPLGRYKTISDEDLLLVSMDLAKLPPDVIRNPDEVVGKRTTRVINSQAVLRPDLIELPLLVKRGAIVSIIAESDSLKVVTLGKAKERGRKGQMIKVENLESNKCIYARVLDANSVMVDI